MGKNNVLIYTEWLEIIEDLDDIEISTLFQNKDTKNILLFIIKI